MLIRNTTTHYGVIAQAIHWLMFLLITGMVFVGFFMDELPKGLLKLQVYGYHKSIGMCVLFLAVLRLAWRLINKVPALPEHIPAYQKFGAHAIHWALYAIMFVIPLTGWMMSSAAGIPVSVFGLFTMPMVIAPDKELRHLFRELHETGAVVFIAVGSVHVLAALVHHFYFKDNILKRMLIPAK